MHLGLGMLERKRKVDGNWHPDMHKIRNPISISWIDGVGVCSVDVEIEIDR